MRIFSLLISLGILIMHGSASYGIEKVKKTSKYVKTYKTSKNKTKAKAAEKSKYKSKAVQDFMDGKTHKLDSNEKI